MLPAGRPWPSEPAARSRSCGDRGGEPLVVDHPLQDDECVVQPGPRPATRSERRGQFAHPLDHPDGVVVDRRFGVAVEVRYPVDRKSTRLNSSHVKISYAVFCLKKKTINLQMNFN